MDSFSSLGVNRSDTRRYRKDLQRQLGNEDTILCKRFSETKYQATLKLKEQLEDADNLPTQETLVSG
jgi:hypothetical protein